MLAPLTNPRLAPEDVVPIGGPDEIESLLDELTECRFLLQCLHYFHRRQQPVASAFAHDLRQRLADLGELFQRLTGRYPSLPLIDPDQGALHAPVYTGATVAPASSP